MTERDQTLKILERIWADMLGVKKVSPDDNFFAVGGHSLLAVRLIAAVQEKLNLGNELKLTDLSAFPTLGAFSDHVKSIMTSDAEWEEI